MRTLLFHLVFTLLAGVSQAQESKISAEGLGIVNSCSAGVVRFPHQSKTSKALVATNGHCLALNLNYGRLYPYPLPNEVLRNLTDTHFLEKTIVRLHGYKGTKDFKAHQLLFGTMTSTDIAIFQLNENYEELLTVHQIPHFEVSDKKLLKNEKVAIRSGLYSRQFQCIYEGDLTLIEGPFSTKPAMAFSKACDFYPGYSGSLIFSVRSGKVVGLANTHASGERDLCEFDNPCSFSNFKIKELPRQSSFGIALNESVFTTRFSLLQLFPKDLVLTEGALQERIRRFNEFATPLLEERGKKLKIYLDPDWSESLGSSVLIKDIFQIEVGRRLFENPRITGDSLDLILCHELGHFLGAGPKKKNEYNDSGDWASGEGESDYFAGKCLAHLWGKSLNRYLQLTTWDTMNRCKDLQSLPKKQFCERVANAGTTFYGYLYDTYAKVGAVMGERPHVDRHDSSKASSHLLDYPSHQCRFDSLISGTLNQNRPSCWNLE